MIFSGKIGRNVFFLAIATICSKCIGFFREILSAHYFGLSETFDIYLSVFVIPSIITSLLLYATPNIIIPKLKLNKDTNDKEFYSYFSSHFLWPYIILLLVIILLYNLCLNIYISYVNIPTIYHAFALEIGRLFSIYICFESFFNLLTVLYNAKERFITPAFLHLILQSCVILFLLLGGAQYGVKAIAYGLSLGAVVEVLIFLFLLNKSKILHFFSLKLSYTPNLFSSVIIILLVELVGQLYSFSDRIFLSELPSGYITGLYYANILKEFPFVILGVTLGGVLLPRITRMFQDKEYSLLLGTMNKMLCRVFVLALFIMLFYFIFGNDLVSLLFERGKFDNDDTNLTSQLLFLYVIALPFIFMHFLLIKFYYTLGKQNTVLVVALISITLKFLLNFIFISHSYYEGLALSTSIAFIFNASSLLGYYLVKLKSIYKAYGSI